MEHDIKCWPEYYQALKKGIKSFELRNDDRNYQVGDTLKIREFDPVEGYYTGSILYKKIICKIKNTKWLQPGICCLGLGCIFKKFKKD